MRPNQQQQPPPPPPLLPPGWRAITDRNPPYRTYYAHSVTGETRWDLPVAATTNAAHYNAAPVHQSSVGRGGGAGTVGPRTLQTCALCSRLKFRLDYTDSEWVRWTLEKVPPTCQDCQAATSDLGALAGGNEPTKPCISCGIDRTRSQYSQKQWKRTIGTGKCIECSKQEFAASLSRQPQPQLPHEGQPDRIVPFEHLVQRKLDARSRIAALPLMQQRKPCTDCSVSKTREEFSIRQWSKKVGTGKCAACAEKAHVELQAAAQRSSRKDCSLCGQKLGASSFSLSQWKRTGASGRECLECQMSRKAVAATVADVPSSERDGDTSVKAQDKCLSQDKEAARSNTGNEEQIDESASLIHAQNTSDIPAIPIGVPQPAPPPNAALHPPTIAASTLIGVNTNTKDSVAAVGNTSTNTCVRQSLAPDPSSPLSAIATATATTDLTKPCVSCGVKKTRTDFSKRQWGVAVGAGKCKACVAQALHAVADMLSSASVTTASSASVAATSMSSSAATTTSVTNSVTERSLSLDDADNPQKRVQRETSAAWTAAASTAIGVELTRKRKANEIFGAQEGYRKQCLSCQMEKPKSEFSRRQWQLKVGTGRCIQCVGSGMSVERECMVCHDRMPMERFSASQWRETTHRKCINCEVVTKDMPEGAQKELMGISGGFVHAEMEQPPAHAVGGQVDSNLKHRPDDLTRKEDSTKATEVDNSSEHQSHAVAGLEGETPGSETHQEEFHDAKEEAEELEKQQNAADEVGGTLLSPSVIGLDFGKMTIL